MTITYCGRIENHNSSISLIECFKATTQTITTQAESQLEAEIKKKGPLMPVTRKREDQLS